MSEQPSDRLRIEVEELLRASCATSASSGVAPRVVVSRSEADRGVPPLPAAGAQAQAKPAGVNKPLALALAVLMLVMVFLTFAATVVVVQSKSPLQHGEQGRAVRMPDEKEKRLVAKSNLGLVAPSVIGRSGRLITSEWSGTAIPWRLDAHGNLVLITNAHVVDGGNKASVPTLEVVFKGEVKRAALAVGIATGAQADLAMIVLDAAGLVEGRHYRLLSPASDGDWSQLAAGDAVVAVGSPYGYPQTQTFGRISALRDGLSPFDHDVRWIQVDATVLPGNSGGPLLQAAGDDWRWIGVVTARGEVGIGFAIFGAEIAETKYNWIFGEPPEL